MKKVANITIGGNEGQIRGFQVPQPAYNYTSRNYILADIGARLECLPVSRIFLSMRNVYA